VSVFTILGANGFIGSALVAHLRGHGRTVNAVTRDMLPELLADGGPVGHVIDCIGLTAEFRQFPLATAEAHVGVTARCLEALAFDSFLYLSTTRVYARASHGREDALLPVNPSVMGDLYNATKLAGEALCLSDRRGTVRVARLSNVYGPRMGAKNFLGQVLEEGARTGAVTLHQSMLSAKDYVSIADVVPALVGIAERGESRIYNVASGVNTTHDALVCLLSGRLFWRIIADDNAVATRFPRIDVTRLGAEFGAPSGRVLDDLPGLAQALAAGQEVGC